MRVEDLNMMLLSRLGGCFGRESKIFLVRRSNAFMYNNAAFMHYCYAKKECLQAIRLSAFQNQCGGQPRHRPDPAPDALPARSGQKYKDFLEQQDSRG